jgi:hypothetical protein
VSGRWQSTELLSSTGSRPLTEPVSNLSTKKEMERKARRGGGEEEGGDGGEEGEERREKEVRKSFLSPDGCGSEKEKKVDGLRREEVEDCPGAARMVTL